MTDETETEWAAAVGAALIAYVRAQVAEVDEHDRRLAAAVAAKQAEGFRIISADQVDGPDDDGRWVLEVTDYVTSDVIWSGTAAMDEFYEMWPDDWWEVGALADVVYEAMEAEYVNAGPDILPPGCVSEGKTEELRAWLTRGPKTVAALP